MGNGRSETGRWEFQNAGAGCVYYFDSEGKLRKADGTEVSSAHTLASHSSMVATGLVIENRTDDPSTPATGQIWLRTDL